MSIGLLLGVGVGQVLASIFVDVSAFDVLVFTLLPARRATRVNPMTALRTD